MVTLTAGNDVQELADILRRVQEFCRTSAVNPDASARINLVVEELFVNFATHAKFPAGCVPKFELRLHASAAGVSCIIRDNAEPFDPRMAPGSPVDGSVDARPVGGLGLRLIRSLASKLDYESADGANTTHILLKD